VGGNGGRKSGWKRHRWMIKKKNLLEKLYKSQCFKILVGPDNKGKCNDNFWSHLNGVWAEPLHFF